MKEIILDTLIDGVKIIPFLFIAFLFIELIEHKLGNKSKKLIAKAGKTGPVFGGLLGTLPQCGFSVMATNLYVTRVITIGTLISIYLSTSDEMLPILLSKGAPLKTILPILLLKFLIGLLAGLIIDFIDRKKNKKIKLDYSICQDEDCNCDNGILIPTIKHTFNTLIFILLISFILNILFSYLGEDVLSKIFLKNSLLGPLIGSLVGLIPNCGASIMLTELYLNNAISFGTAIGGLLTGSGVAIIVLFKENKNIKENIKILGLIYIIGSISGLIIEIVRMIV